MVILIPFLTQPTHERTLTGRGSRVYPNVGAAGCGLVGAGGVLGLRPRGLLYKFVLYNSYKKMYELVQKPHRVRIRTIQFV
jgi:hypothetical protein